MANDNCLEGMICPNPECKSEGPFRIVSTLSVLVYDDGTEDDKMSGNTEWDSGSPCSCYECNHAGKVRDFQIEPELLEFSVLLFYPEEVWEKDPETYYGHIKAANKEDAVKQAIEDACKSNDWVVEDMAPGFKELLVLEGHHSGI